MGIPKQPIELTPDQIEELNKKLSTMRHNINNYLSLVVAATELMRYKPDMIDKMVVTVGDQPNRIIEEVRLFSKEFETALSITRDSPKV